MVHHEPIKTFAIYDDVRRFVWKVNNFIERVDDEGASVEEEGGYLQKELGELNQKTAKKDHILTIFNGNKEITEYIDEVLKRGRRLLQLSRMLGRSRSINDKEGFIIEKKTLSEGFKKQTDDNIEEMFRPYIFRK